MRGGAVDVLEAGRNSRLPRHRGNLPSCRGRAAASSGMTAGPAWSPSRNAASGLDQNSPGSGGRGSAGSAVPPASGRSAGTPAPAGPPGPCHASGRSGRGRGRTPRPEEVHGGDVLARVGPVGARAVRLEVVLPVGEHGQADGPEVSSMLSGIRPDSRLAAMMGCSTMASRMRSQSGGAMVRTSMLTS